MSFQNIFARFALYPSCYNLGMFVRQICRGKIFLNNPCVCPEAETIDQELGVDACDAKAIADYLWSHTGVIEEYLATAAGSDPSFCFITGTPALSPHTSSCSIAAARNVSAAPSITL